MNRLDKVLTSFKNLREAAMVPAAGFIIESMEGNAAFPNPPVTTVAMQALVDSYNAALKEAASRDRNKIAVKNQLRRQLNTALSQNGKYVNMVAEGDVPVLVSSGYTLAKQPEPRYLSVPANLTVTPGVNPGSLVCKVRADKAATGYIHMITPAPLAKENEWLSVNTSRAQHEFTDLEQGKEYVVKVAAIGSNDQVAYSDTVSRFAA